MRGIVLYGPPASGKDTVTEALTRLDPSYRLYRRLKAGPGRTSGYRMTNAAHVDELRSSGDIVWENRRYESVYVVDRPSLRECLENHVPVVHLGQLEAIEAIQEAFPDAVWTTVYLHCPREEALARIVSRATGDVDARVSAWDATESFPEADLSIDTSQTSPADAAALVSKVSSLHQGGPCGAA
ncbi:AAA family ATPase [Lentzea sp. NPDC004789]